MPLDLLVRGLKSYFGLGEDEDGDFKEFYSSSEAVQKVEYDSDEGILMVRFTTGAEYNYYGVSAQKFRRFREAGSKGQYLNWQIKGNYLYGRIG